MRLTRLHLSTYPQNRCAFFPPFRTAKGKPGGYSRLIEARFPARLKPRPFKANSEPFEARLEEEI